MARPKRSSSESGATIGQASYVLERLVAERRVSPGEVNRYVAEMGGEIAELERRLQQLRDAHGESQMRGQTGIRPKRVPGRPDRPPGRPPGYGPAPAVPPTPSFLPPFPKPPKAPPEGPQKRPEGATRKFTVTAKVLASRELQGRYLPLLNKFSGKKRQQYTKLAKEKGREVAIKEMTSALKK